MKEKVVLPGEFLAYEEEFMAGENAFEDDDGNVYSSSIGVKEEDTSKHEVSVKGSNSKNVLSVGSIVKGVVSVVRNSGVTLEIHEAEKNGKPVVVPGRMASLPIRNMSNDYVKDASDLFRVGDIVKARVVFVSSFGIDLETKAPEFGVIKAFGIRSRKPLVLIGEKLRDPVLGTTENRKISNDYILR